MRKEPLPANPKGKNGDDEAGSWPGRATMMFHAAATPAAARDELHDESPEIAPSVPANGMLPFTDSNPPSSA
jgi:hypothetical protein